MMKTKISILLTAISIILSVKMNAQIRFQKTIGGDNEDNAVSILEIQDGYLIAGSTENFTAGGVDIFAIRVNNYGDIIWSNNYGGTNNDYAQSAILTNDNNFVIAGYTESFGYGGQDIYLLKIDLDGNVIWSKIYGSVNVDERPGSVFETIDNGFFLAGRTGDTYQGTYNVFAIKTDCNGIMQWNTTFGGSSTDYALGGIQTDNGKYFIAGSIYSYGAGLHDMLLCKLDTSGNLLWSRTYGGSDNDGLNNIYKNTNGDIFLVGNTWSYGAGENEGCVINIDEEGIINWCKVYGDVNNDRITALDFTPDGGLILKGWTESVGFGLRDVLLVKTDSVGNIQWTKTYGGTSNESMNVNRIICTNDNGYIFAGYTESFGQGASDIYLVKTDSEGWSGCNEKTVSVNVISPTISVNSYTFSPSTIASEDTANTITNNINLTDSILCHTAINSDNFSDQHISVYPNPASEVINIQSENNRHLLVEVTNIHGQQIEVIKTGTGFIQIDLSEYPAGFYFVKVSDGDYILTEKIVVYKR